MSDIQRRYRVTLTGATALLLHRDNLEWQEYMKRWESDPANRAASVAGDDRTPAHRWIGCLYVANGLLVVDSDNLMTVFREGGAKCPTGKKGATFKRATQSGMVVDEIGWPITIDGETVPFEKIKALETVPDFATHLDAVSALGFSLFVKRARVGQSKHVRVRPRFDRWQIQGHVTVFDETITRDVLQNIVTFAGKYAGIGDWRPSAPKSPGPYGKFLATVEEV